MKFENGILFADEGKIVTNGETYGKQIHRLSNEMVKDWYEITEAEYQEILKEEELNNGNFEN